LSANDTRFYTKLSDDFEFEVFSPHIDDMNSSNNCSLVCKIRERSTDMKYLVTGDTENERWISIVRYFGSALKCDVLQAPHHGSRNGVSAEVMLYQRHAQAFFRTNYGEGQSLRTSVTRAGIKTYLFKI
jgi:hypothetical protein